jgi:hypothetical protein
MFKVSVPEMIVKLPSAGKSEYSPAEVKLRAITGKEEMKMNSTSLSKYIDLVLRECVKDNATNAPINVDKLSSEDKVYLFIMLRSLSYGDSMSASYRCQNCGEMNSTSMELSKLPIDFLTDDKLANLVITLPVSGITLEMRLLTDSELYELDAEARQMEIKTKRPAKECRDLLMKMRRIKSMTYEDSELGILTEENTTANRSLFQLLVENLIGKDLAYLDRKWGAANDYGVKLTVDHKCASCGNLSTIGVDVSSSEFFRPSEAK